MAEKQSLGSLVSGVSEDISTLLRGEIELVKTEIKESARTAGKGSGLLVGAAVLGFLGIIFVLLTLAWVLVQLGLPTWAGFGIVALVLLIVTAILGLLGKKQLESIKGPERSPASIAKTKAVLSRSPAPADPGTSPVTPVRAPATGAPAPARPSTATSTTSGTATSGTVAPRTSTPPSSAPTARSSDPR
jgi:hypothetical protein